MKTTPPLSAIVPGYTRRNYANIIKGIVNRSGLLDWAKSIENKEVLFNFGRIKCTVFRNDVIVNNVK